MLRARRPDYTAAIAYYSQALQLVPEIGNPHNQLAILATYTKDYCGAVSGQISKPMPLDAQRKREIVCV